MDTNSFILTLLNMKGWGPKKVHSYVWKHDFDYKKCVDGLVDELDDIEKYYFKQELAKSKLTLQKNYDKGVNAINILDKVFPSKLYVSDDKCVFLYYVGNVDLLNKKSIAIIGTRMPDEEFVNKGITATKFFAKDGIVVVSGLALGCDSVAHQACLDVYGETIAVLPSPCDNPQPISNKGLALNIIANGGLLISEYGTGATVTKFNYPRRDRIQSLLSSTVLIIQASDNSGTMIATKKAIKDGKNVYAIKGNNLLVVKKYVDIESEEEMNEIKKSLIDIDADDDEKLIKGINIIEVPTLF